MSMILLITFQLWLVIFHGIYIQILLVFRFYVQAHWDHLKMVWFCIWHRNNHNNNMMITHNNNRWMEKYKRSMVTYLEYMTFDANGPISIYTHKYISMVNMNFSRPIFSLLLPRYNFWFSSRFQCKLSVFLLLMNGEWTKLFGVNANTKLMLGKKLFVPDACHKDEIWAKICGGYISVRAKKKLSWN